MSRFDIKSADGSVTRYSGKLKYHGTYLSPSYIEFTQINSDTPIAFAIGDYVDYDRTGQNVRYRLYSLPMPKRNAGNGTHGESFTYSNVQFFNESKILELAPCRDFAYVGGQPYFSSKSDFAVFITVADMGARIRENLNRYEGSDKWRVRVQSGLEGYNETEARNVSVSGSCLSALAVIYDVWPGLGWIFAYETDPTDEELHPTIIIGGANKRTSANTTNRYEYGSGLVSLKKSISNAEEFSTRLRVFGSTRNMPANWYSRRTDIYNAGSTFIPNLMLPFTHDGQDVWGKTDGKYDADKAYFEDANAIAKYGLIEKSVYFDGSNNSEIYPSIEGVTIAELKTAKAAVGKTEAGKPDFFPQSSAGTTRIDAIKAITDPIIDDGDMGQDSPYIEDVTQKVTMNWHIEATPSGTSRTALWESALQAHTFTHEGSVVVSITPLLLTYVQNQYSMINAIRYQLVYRVNGTPIDKYSDWKLVVAGEQISENEQVITFPDYIVVGDFDNIVSGQVTVRLEVEVYIPHPSQGHPYEYYITSLDDSAVTFRMRPLLKDRFQIRIPQIGFDMATVVGTPMLSMRSGMCAGREFAVTGTQYESETDTWLVTLNRETDSSLNRRFPNTGSNIAVGDTFVVLGVNMPEEYIEIASDRLYVAGEELFDKSKSPVPAYEPQLDSKYILEQIEENPDDDTYVLREGKYMNLLDDPLTADADEYVIIDTLTIAEDESNIPVYSVTLRDLKSISFARGVETAIRGINVSISNLSNTSGNVTEADRQRWNNKQDVIIDLQSIRDNAGNAVLHTSDQGLSDTQKSNARTNIGLGNVDNTSDLNKPISTATQQALNAKADNTPTFQQAATRANLSGSGETMPTILGKIKKWFADLGSLAFKSSVANVDVAANANIEGSKIQVASTTNSGVVSTGAQTFAGDKTFLDNIIGQKGVSAMGINDLTVFGGGGGSGYDEGAVRYNEEQDLTLPQQAQARENIGAASEAALDDKQDVIDDLDDIREGAEAGATALQPSAISDMETQTHAGRTYATKTELDSKEDKSNKVSTWPASADLDKCYPSTTLLSNALALKLNKSGGTITGDIVPSENGTISLGSAANQFFRNLYIQTLHSNATLTLAAGGNTGNILFVYGYSTLTQLGVIDKRGNMTMEGQVVGKQGVAALGIADLAVPAIASSSTDEYKDLIHKKVSVSGNSYTLTADSEGYARQYIVLELEEGGADNITIIVTLSERSAEQYILLDNWDSTTKNIAFSFDGTMIGDTAIDVAAGQSCEVSVIHTVGRDADGNDESYLVVTGHDIMVQ